MLRTRYGTVILPRELRTGRWMELDKTDIDNLAKSVELNHVKVLACLVWRNVVLKKWQKNHWLHVVVVIYVSNVDDEQDQSQQQQRPSSNGNNNNGRKTIGFNKGFKKF